MMHGAFRMLWHSTEHYRGTDEKEHPILHSLGRWQYDFLPRNAECRYLASSSKDGSVRIWDTLLCRTEKIMTGHTQTVTCVKWGGDGLLYTSSQDRTIKVWRASDVRFKADAVPCVYISLYNSWTHQQTCNVTPFFWEVLCDNGEALIYISMSVL